jgi:hypothetical protein
LLLALVLTAFGATSTGASQPAGEVWIDDAINFADAMNSVMEAVGLPGPEFQGEEPGGEILAAAIAELQAMPHTNWILKEGTFVAYNVSTLQQLHPPLKQAELNNIQYIYFSNCPNLNFTLDESGWLTGQESALFDLHGLVLDENTTLAEGVFDSLCDQLRTIGQAGIDSTDIETTVGGVTEIDEDKDTTSNLQHIGIYCKDITEIPDNFLYTRYSAGTDMTQDEGIGCRSLVSITLPYVKYVGENFLHGCVALNYVHMPRLIAAKYNLLDECSVLQQISLPSLVVAGRNSISECAALVNVDLPNLETDNLVGLSAAKDVRLPVAWQATGGNVVQTDDHGCLFNHCVALKRLYLPKFNESTGTFAKGCSGLQTVNLPVLTAPGPDFLQNCINLEEISLDALTACGNNFLSGFAKLESINLPAVTEVGNRFAQNGTVLKNINLPLVGVIGDSFAECCTALVSLYLPVCTKVGERFLYKCPALEILICPKLGDIGAYSIGWQSGDITSWVYEPNVAQLNNNPYPASTIKVIHIGGGGVPEADEEDSEGEEIPTTGVVLLRGPTYDPDNTPMEVWERRIIHPRGEGFINTTLILGTQAYYCYTGGQVGGAKWPQGVNGNSWGGCGWKQIITGVDFAVAAT